MKITILTDSISNLFALALLLKLKENNHNVAIIINKKYTFKRLRKKIIIHGFRRVIKRIIFRPSVFKNNFESTYIKNYIKEKCSPVITLKRLIKRKLISYIFVEDTMSNKTLFFLKKERPDLIIFAGGGIIREKLIILAKIGVLNAHMGLLPKYRGMNVLEWSIFNKDPLGITIHFIDKGIDTGKILSREYISVSKHDSISSLRAKSIPLSIETLSEVINKIEKGKINPLIQKREEGKQYFIMHNRLKNIIENKLLKSDNIRSEYAKDA